MIASRRESAFKGGPLWFEKNLKFVTSRPQVFDPQPPIYANVSGDAKKDASKMLWYSFIQILEGKREKKTEKGEGKAEKSQRTNWKAIPISHPFSLPGKEEEEEEEGEEEETTNVKEKTIFFSSVIFYRALVSLRRLLREQKRAYNYNGARQ